MLLTPLIYLQTQKMSEVKTCPVLVPVDEETAFKRVKQLARMTSLAREIPKILFKTLPLATGT